MEAARQQRELMNRVSDSAVKPVPGKADYFAFPSQNKPKNTTDTNKLDFFTYTQQKQGLQQKQVTPQNRPKNNTTDTNKLDFFTYTQQKPGLQQKQGPQQYSKPKSNPQSGNTFYTNEKHDDIIIPKLGSIAEYEKAIEDNKKKLEDIHQRQYDCMLKGDGATVDALEKQYKATEQELNGYKIGLGAVMGANVSGKRGNQLLDDDRWNTTQDGSERAPLMGVETPTPGEKPGLHIRNQSPQFDMDNKPKHVAGLGYPVGPGPVQGPPPRQEDMDDYKKDLEENEAAVKDIGDDDYVLDFFRKQRKESEGTESNKPTATPSVNDKPENSGPYDISKDIKDDTIKSALESAVEETGGYLLNKTEKGALEYVAEGIPYVGMVYDCFGQYFASEDAKTALLENYVNFGANSWNQKNGNEYKDALVWSPMDTFDCDQEFMDRALELQNELEIAGMAGYPDCSGMYWDDLLEDDRQVKEYNKQHPEGHKESKLDFLSTWVTSMTNPAFKDFTNEVYIPFGKIAVDSWVTIYFDSWGMNY